MKRGSPRRGADEGTTSVEVAFVMGAFLLVLFGVMEFAIDLWIWNSMMHAVEQGGRCAMAFYQSPTNQKNTTCENLWTSSTSIPVDTCGSSTAQSLQSFVQNYLPGSSSGYVLSHTCMAAASPLPARMTISASYTIGSMSVPGVTTTGRIPGLTLTTQATVPLN
jgi:Flp pilus assembly protein TadG